MQAGRFCAGIVITDICRKEIFMSFPGWEAWQPPLPQPDGLFFYFTGFCAGCTEGGRVFFLKSKISANNKGGSLLCQFIANKIQFPSAPPHALFFCYTHLIRRSPGGEPASLLDRGKGGAGI